MRPCAILFLLFPATWSRYWASASLQPRCRAMSLPVSITASVLERILGFLTPLFRDSDLDDAGAAREAARDVLSSYGARTNRELRIAALCIAFGYGALDALSRAAAPELPLNQVMRLRGNANALNRAAQQNESRLEKLQKQPPVEINEAEPVTADGPVETLPATSATADLLAYARSKFKSMINVGTPAVPVAAAPLSRQQRRDGERKAEKAQKQKEGEARRVERAMQRMAAVGGSARQGIHA